MKKKVVSVVLPAYNAEKYIKDTIESVLNQSYQELELLIIDDGSKDNTLNICKEFEKDKRVRIFSKTNTGVSDTRNVGLENSMGEYIVFIDSDDLFKKNYIECMLNYLEQNGSDLAICGYEYFGEINKKFISPLMLNEKPQCIIKKLQNNCMFNQLWNKCYKASIIKGSNIRFNSELDLGEDAIFNIEYIKQCRKITVIQEDLYKYRITKNGLGFKYRKNAGELKLKIFYRMRDLFDSDEMKKYIEKNILKQYIAWFANILDKRNDISFNIKKNEIKKILKSEQYKKDLVYMKKNFLFNLLYIPYVSIFLGLLAQNVDKLQKKKFFKS